MLKAIEAVVSDPRTERVITVLIIINAIVLGLDTSAAMREHFGPTLELIDHVILTVFAAELAARILVERLRFPRNPWNVFDFVVVGISLVPTAEMFSVLRALRILRVLRLITAVPTLKRVVGGLLAALPGMGSIVLLISLIYYVFAVMATKLFGDDVPNLFGTLGDSLFTLFTVMTLEGWVDGVTKPVMEKHPYGWVFFITFIIVTTFMVLNLFIGVVVNAMQAEAVKEMEAEREAEREMIQEEAGPILAEVKALRQEVATLRAELAKAQPAQ
ncbi:ion transporter [Xanthobacteraceae bacterium Astr-EGSB]|uniref:ion transporter n=1 Tax=Astrobacterium formosum TaxID=3069710 RepID=UPI0027B25C67|nr:ion transporter [Xanthobacteraceae bacterium Astr-EGSB]